MKPRLLVGNDVVDIAWVRKRQQATNRRFFERVFTAAERAAIASAEDPDVELWCHWAAKETAFKVVSKRLGTPPVFVHRAFPVRWSDGTSAADAHAGRVVREGVVRYESATSAEAEPPGPVSVTIERHDHVLHAVGYEADVNSGQPDGVHGVVANLEEPGGAWNGTLEELRPRFSEREVDAVYSRESAAVRVGAKACLATALAVAVERIEIVCAAGAPGRRPPSVLVDGEGGLADVSLSHHGAWIAWAIWCA